jgi:hypothetical protein
MLVEGDLDDAACHGDRPDGYFFLVPHQTPSTGRQSENLVT